MIFLVVKIILNPYANAFMNHSHQFQGKNQLFHEVFYQYFAKLQYQF